MSRGGGPNLIGKRFGRLKVVERAATTGQAQIWRCICDCGNETLVKTALLHRDDAGTKSCGCLKRDYWRSKKTRHGKTNTTEHNIWKTMLARCQNPTSNSYHRYGALGVTVCERWQSFEAFLQDMGPRPSSGHSLDRFPNRDGNYEPGNVRWATSKQQNRNRRNNRLVVVRGESMPLAAACEKYGADYHAAVRKLKNGRTIEQALGLE